MKPGRIFHRNSRSSAFTLTEVMVVVIIIGVLAAIAMPRYEVAVEKVRASEGVNILTALLSAEKRYALDNNNTYTAVFAQLDFTMPGGWGNFGAPTLTAVAVGGNGVVAQLPRNDQANYDLDGYTLSITENTGTVACVEGASTTAGTCTKLGF